MTNKLKDARRSLLRAKEAAEARLNEIDTERRETKASIKSLEAAIRALGPTEKKPVTPDRSATAVQSSPEME